MPTALAELMEPSSRSQILASQFHNKTFKIMPKNELPHNDIIGFQPLEDEIPTWVEDNYNPQTRKHIYPGMKSMYHTEKEGTYKTVNKLNKRFDGIMHST